jgi:hypothetical protein
MVSRSEHKESAASFVVNNGKYSFSPVDGAVQQGALRKNIFLGVES